MTQSLTIICNHLAFNHDQNPFPIEKNSLNSPYIRTAVRQHNIRTNCKDKLERILFISLDQRKQIKNRKIRKTNKDERHKAPIQGYSPLAKVSTKCKINCSNTHVRPHYISFKECTLEEKPHLPNI